MKPAIDPKRTLNSKAVGQLGISTDAVAQQLSQHLPAMAQAHAASDGGEGYANA